MASRDSFVSGAEILHNGNKTLDSPELYLYATLLYAKGGYYQQAAEELLQSIDAGMSNWNILAKDQALAIIKQASVWPVVKAKLDSIRRKMSDPASFTISLDPVETFISVIANKGYTHCDQATFEDFILQGGEEVRDSYFMMYKSSVNASKIIRDSADVYSLVEEIYDAGALNSILESTEEYISKFSALFDSGTYPTVYIVPGIFTSGGTATNVGTFIGIEKFVKQAYDSLGTVDSTVLYEAIEKMPYTIFHELMHFQQVYSGDDPSTVLYKVIEEGAATFLTALFTGGDITEVSFEFLQDSSNMMAVLDSLQNDLLTSNTSRWMYNEGSEEWPRDVGYYIGAEICRSYYQKQSDKRAAVKEILMSKNLAKIVEGSEYGWILD